MVVFQNVKKEDMIILKQLGFSPADPKTMYEVIRYTKDEVTAILYTSGKLFLQGKEENVEKIADRLRRKKIGEEKRKQSFRKETGWIIGSDETLKGDTFGGLIVAAVKADNKIREQLLEIGVADSKKLSDREILSMAEKVKRIAPCELKSLLPEEYNVQIKQGGNITVLLDKMHQDCARDLAQGGNGKHVVDKYPGCSVGDLIETKAESKYIEVAAASILARAAALKQLDFLSVEAGFKLPKGSTHVEEALQELRENHIDFKKFVKTNFVNVKKFL